VKECPSESLWRVFFKQINITIEVMKEGGLVISEEEFNKWHGANKIEAIRHFAQQQKPEVS